MHFMVGGGGIFCHLWYNLTEKETCEMNVATARRLKTRYSTAWEQKCAHNDSDLAQLLN